LVDIKLEGLRLRRVGNEEHYVVGEVVESRGEFLVMVRQVLRGTIADQVVVPKDIGVDLRATDREFGRVTSLTWITDPLCHTPSSPGTCGSAGAADGIVRRQ